jgi:hypothetical protein
VLVGQGCRTTRGAVGDECGAMVDGERTRRNTCPGTTSSAKILT